MPIKPDVIKERRKNDPEFLERQREYARKYRERNKEKELIRQRQIATKKRSDNREAYNEYMRNWTDKNKERLNTIRRERRKNDPQYAEKIRERDRARPKDQVKNTRIRNDYGITLDDFNKLRESQNFRCAICGVHEDNTGVKKLAIDHCHNKGHVRGLLCSHCNTGLGQFKDNIDILTKAIEYLKRS